MEITVRIEAPELAAAIKELAQAWGTPKTMEITVPVPEPQPEPEPEPEVKQAVVPNCGKPKPAPAPEPEPEAVQAPQPESEAKADAPEVSLEAVRKILSELSRAGKQKDVKELILSMGANKLTDVEPAKYAELLAKAKELS